MNAKPERNAGPQSYRRAVISLGRKKRRAVRKFAGAAKTHGTHRRCYIAADARRPTLAVL
jgi:hypothetical protein